MSKRPPRSGAEWTTFAVALAILLVIVGAIGVEASRPSTPPDPVAKIDGARRDLGGRFHVDVVVENRGDETAEAVQVVASLEIDGEPLETDETVDFLAGGDQAELTFVFEQDPDEGELSVRVAGFQTP